MKIKDQAAWDLGWNNNEDPYGRRCYTYAKDWADLMEARLAEGQSIADVADMTSRLADTDGITGFMFGAAVSVLVACWEHGEELRAWHKKERV